MSEDQYSVDQFIAASPSLARVRKLADRVASRDVPFLIIGESGVGKGALAAYLHATGRFSSGPLVKVNCAALPRNLLESELFGHERGAFTGATTSKPGRFQQAAGGTLLLDEIGELPLDLQAKLLHVFDDHCFQRVGGSATLRLEARIVAATNRSLERAVADGKFRDDLFFRLAVVWVEVPPLRERPEDVLALASHFYEEYCLKYNGEGDQEPPSELIDVMLDYHWPGNVRELKNFVQRCVIFPEQRPRLATIPPPADGGAATVAEPHPPARLPDPGSSLLDIGAAAADRAEKRAALRALEASGWNRKEAAKRLKVSYKTLLNKLHKWEDVGT